MCWGGMVPVPPSGRRTVALLTSVVVVTNKNYVTSAERYTCQEA